MQTKMESKLMNEHCCQKAASTGDGVKEKNDRHTKSGNIIKINPPKTKSQLLGLISFSIHSENGSM